MGLNPLQLFFMGRRWVPGGSWASQGRRQRCGRWSLEREREVNQGQSSLHNFILSHYQSILSHWSFLFFFIISWTYMGVMAFNALSSACCKLNTNLMKEWTQLASEAGRWRPSSIEWGHGGQEERLVGIQRECVSVQGGGYFEIKCNYPPWLLP